MNLGFLGVAFEFCHFFSDLKSEKMIEISCKARCPAKHLFNL